MSQGQQGRKHPANRLFLSDFMCRRNDRFSYVSVPVVSVVVFRLHACRPSWAPDMNIIRGRCAIEIEAEYLPVEMYEQPSAGSTHQVPPDVTLVFKSSDDQFDFRSTPGPTALTCCLTMCFTLSVAQLKARQSGHLGWFNHLCCLVVPSVRGCSRVALVRAVDACRQCTSYLRYSLGSSTCQRDVFLKS